MEIYKFVREENKWFIDLPEYIAGGGYKGDLQMVEGADKMLDIMAGESDYVNLSMAREAFADADKLILTEICDPILGGGMYFIKAYDGQEINQTMWLCEVTKFVFGDLPEEIFVKVV
ncbi:MAG: hypothetical protein J0I41_03385 [Filimonas sp.]|nr:hypothetical protein [Filimonas sp.]